MAQAELVMADRYRVLTSRENYAKYVSKDKDIKFCDGYLHVTPQPLINVFVMRVTIEKYNLLQLDGQLTIYRKAVEKKGSRVLPLLATQVVNDNEFNNNAFVYLCFPACMTLQKFIAEESRRYSFEILRKLYKDIVYGVKELHDDDKVHGDLTPEKIFVQVGGRRPRASVFLIALSFRHAGKMVKDYGTKGWRAKEVIGKTNRDKESDLFNLGMVLAYCIYGGRDVVFGSPHAKEYRISQGNPFAFQTHMVPNNGFEAHNVLEGLLCHKPAERLKCEEVLKHLYFWKVEERMRFVCSSNTWQNHNKGPNKGGPGTQTSTSSSVRRKKTSTSLIRTFTGDSFQAAQWTSKIDKSLASWLSQKKIFTYKDTAKELLRFLRNNYAHFYEYDASLQATWITPSGLDSHMQKLFPDFLTEVYKICKTNFAQKMEEANF